MVTEVLTEKYRIIISECHVPPNSITLVEQPTANKRGVPLGLYYSPIFSFSFQSGKPDPASLLD